MDKATQILLDALRQGTREQGEQRLYRAGKLPGLFSGKTTINAELAAQAIREGYIELVRTEARGKTVIEWARITSKGVEFVVQHESPLKVLEDLHETLRMNQEGLPSWFAELQTRLDAVGQKLVDEFQEVKRKLDWLSNRVVEALQRAERIGPAVENGAVGVLPWSNDAVHYLEERGQASVGPQCPLPELFHVVRKKDPELTIRDFHSGLRRLHDRGVIRLLTFEGEDGPPEPEYALLDGAAVYYFAAGLRRAG